MNLGIEGKLVAHDRHQFELKLGYTLDPKRFQNNYKIELFFFIPRSLGINHHTYPKHYFFSDIQGYIRFKTPAFTFNELLDPHSSRSPLTRLHTIFSAQSGMNRDKLISELKLYGCVFRVALRNSVNEIRSQINHQRLENISEEIDQLCSSVESSLMRFRELRTHIDTSAAGDDIARAYLITDEYIGIILDDLLNSLNTFILASEISGSTRREISEGLSQVILKEFEYRKKSGYAIYTKDGENELFLYRKSLLKKLVTSALFLETHTQEGTPYIRDFVFAVAAGVAMMLATVVTIWAGLKWSTTSIPFVLAIVIGYMLKDRIKDWLKYAFSARMTKWLSDYKTDIIDLETHKKIGVCRQAFSFISQKFVPPDILELRKKGHHHSSDFWLPEDIIKYEKDVTLRPSAIVRSHSRLSDITDIIRFNIHRFLDRMDDPYEVHHAIDPATGNVDDFSCARVYHVNLILKLADKTKRLRLIMDQSGLKRVEEVR